MLRYIILLIVILFCGCNKIKTSGSLNIDSLNIEKVLNSSECKNTIKTSGYTEEYLVKIFDKIKNEDIGSLDEITLILYSEEGELINNFSVALFFKDTVCKVILYINNKKTKTIEVQHLKSNQLNNYLKKGFQSDKPYPNQLLILDLKPKNISCSFTRNLSPYLVTEIKELSFFDNTQY